MLSDMKICTMMNKTVMVYLLFKVRFRTEYTA
jgi:hypothetical protein